MPKLAQVSMASGEVSPSLYPRVDLARYATSLRRCRDYIVRKTGGVANRPGTHLVSFAQVPDEPVRLIPFIFSEDQSYVLEFSDATIAIYNDGALVSALALVATITLIEKIASPSELRRITTAAPHGLAENDLVKIINVQGVGWGFPFGYYRVRTVPTTTTFTIDNTSGSFGLYTSGGEVYNPITVPSPFASEDLSGISFTQSADIVTLVHEDYWPQEFSRLSSNLFQIEDGVFEDGPFEPINDDPTIYVHASADHGTVTLTATSDIFLAGHIGALFYIEQQDGHEIPPWEPGKRLVDVGGNPAGLLRSSDGKNYVCVTNTVAAADEIVTGTVRPTHDIGVEADGNGLPITDGPERAGVDWEFRDPGYGILEITAVASGTSATGRVVRRLPYSVVGGVTTVAGPWTMVGDGVDTTLSIALANSNNRYDYEVTFDGVIQDPETYTVDGTTDVLTFFTAPAAGVDVDARQLDPNHRTNVWAFGAWSEINGYPTEVEYYGDRLIFASNRAFPQTVWMSKVGDYRKFVHSVPITDDDSITVTLNARELNKITDLVALDNLAMLTGRGTWRVLGGRDEVITPTSISFKPQSKYGANDLPAQIIGNSGVYVHKNGQTVYDLAYTVEVDGYTGNELSVTAQHLFLNNPITDITYQEDDLWCIWLPREDGLVASMTYLPEHDVIGWGLHNFSDAVESVCCVPENGKYSLYMVVVREVEGVEQRLIERLADRYPADPLDYCFLDSALSYDGRNTTTTTMKLTGSGWIVDDDLTLTASKSVFGSTANNEGDIIVLRSGDDVLRVRLINYVSSTKYTVNPLKNVPLSLQSESTSDWDFAHKDFGGLDHLIGRMVRALVDGSPTDELEVDEDGYVHLEEPGVRVHIGLPYTPTVETLGITIFGGAETIAASTKNVPNVSVQVEETRGIFAGPDEDHMQEYKERDEEDYSEHPGPLTETVTIPVDCDWNRNGRVVIQQQYPLPSTIGAIIPHVRIGGSS